MAPGEHLCRDGLAFPLLGDDERRGDVDEDPCAAEQREDDKAEPVDVGVEVEVPPEAGAHARENAVGGGTIETLDA